MFDLTGRVAIVTGGNGGIGLGMAKGLAKAGARVVVAARNRDKSSAAVAELKALGCDALALTVDVTDERSVEALAADAARAVRPHRHPGQQRRHQHPQAGARVAGGAVAAGDRHQPDQRLRLLARRVSAPEARRRRQDRQHRLDAVDLRCVVRAGLWREQGRHRAVDQVAGGGLGRRQHPGQRGAAGLDRHRPHAPGPAAAARPQRAGAGALARRAAGARSTTSRASRCFWRALHRRSSPAPRSRWTAVIRPRCSGGRGPAGSHDPRRRVRSCTSARRTRANIGCSPRSPISRRRTGATAAPTWPPGTPISR